jgi:4-hydroxy-tetrahydrodipicolinate reductase
LHHNIPIVSGTTGWLEHYDDMTSLCTSKNGAFIYGSNFSLGVNLFFELNAHLAKIMSRFNQYEVSMEEIHHTQKLDKPSGTAITLAQNIIKEKNLSSWSIENPNENELFIDVKRIDSVPGTHSISYTSEVDTIEITHTAHNRDGFALGAVIASEWLINKKGIYTMKDVLGL